MSLMHLDELKSLTGDERDHLRQLEEALLDAMLASQVTVQTNGLDAERMARATTTILMAITARHARDAIEPEATSDEFGALASAVLGWAVDRTLPRRTLWH